LYNISLITTRVQLPNKFCREVIWPTLFINSSTGSLCSCFNRTK